MFMGVGFAFWLLFALSIILGDNLPFPGFHFIGFVGFGVAILCMIFLIKCPRCGSQLGQLGMACALTVTTKDQVNFCPHCGVSFDEPM